MSIEEPDWTQRKLDAMTEAVENWARRAHAAEARAEAEAARVAELEGALRKAEAELAKHQAPPSVFRNCYLHPKRGQDFASFSFNGGNDDGTLFGASINLDGYAVVPLDEFETSGAKAAMEKRS